MTKLLKLVNYEFIEVIELWWTYWILWTMNFMNYELWTAMNSIANCDMVNCWEGSKVLCLYLCVRGMNVWRQ